MKVRTFIFMTGAMFAVAAPAAQASFDRMLPAKHGIVAHHKVVAKKQSTGSAARTTPLYIQVPGPSAPASSATSGDDCATSGNNCTDQQACDLWSINCDLVGSSSNDASPAAPVSAPDPSSTAVDTSTPVDNSVNDLSTASADSTSADDSSDC